MLGNPPAAGHGVLRDRIVDAAKNRHTAVIFVEVQEPGDYDAAFATIRKERADAILALPDPLNTAIAQRKKVAEFALKNRLPTIAIWRPYAESGFLIAYGASLREQWTQAAVYVDKILRGANPGELPIEESTKCDFIVNLKTAKALGLTIPPSLLLRANQLIE